jgi:D-amino-acid dehydrogenase
MELPAQLEFDAVVLATGPDALPLLREAGADLPLQPVWGRTATFRLRNDWAQLPLRSALVDAETGIRLTRMGQRLRVGGGHVLGALPQGDVEQLFMPLYQVLDRWLPLAARRGDVQIWQGARPTLPDGLPLIGPAPLEGVWLQLGHADHGWTLACGAARLLADQIAGRSSEIDATPFASLASRGWS